VTKHSVYETPHAARGRVWFVLVVVIALFACDPEPEPDDAGFLPDAGSAFDAGGDGDGDGDGGVEPVPSVLSCQGEQATCQGPPVVDGGYQPDDLFYTMVLNDEACGSESKCACADESNCPIEIFIERRYVGSCASGDCNLLGPYATFDVQRVFLRAGAIEEWSTSAWRRNCLKAFSAIFPSAHLRFDFHHDDWAFDVVTGFTLTPKGEERHFFGSGSYSGGRLIEPPPVPTPPQLSTCPSISPASCPVPPSPALVAVRDATCLLNSDCSVRCFDDEGARESPVLPFVALRGHVYTDHVCGRRADTQDFACFRTGVDPSYPKIENSAFPLGVVRDLAVSMHRTCAIDEWGTLRCMASTGGNPYAGGCPSLPDDVGPMRSVTFAGARACALDDDGFARCSGPIGLDATPVPTDVAFQLFVGGMSHACGIRLDDQSLVCFGANADGQATPPPGAFVDVSAGVDLTCAIRADDAALVCFGAPDLLLGVPEGAFTSVAISRGNVCAWDDDGEYVCSGSVCALRDDGEVICWDAEKTWSIPACE